MKALARVPFAKFCAVTAALACAGGGAFAGQSVTASAATPPATPPAVTLDHYLCAGDFGHAGCDPVTVALPDGTTFGVNDPGDHLVCDRMRHATDGTDATVHVVNEFSPTGPAGATPVDLTERRLRSTCTVTPVGSFPQSQAKSAATPLAQYTCASVHYPWPPATQFQSPTSLTINNQMSVQLVSPSRLCVPAGAGTAANGLSELLCFHISVAQTTRRHGVFWNFAPWLRLCVPSSEVALPPAANPSSTTTSSSTSTTGSTTTTNASTTTTGSTTTTSTTTTTTTTRPTTTTASTTTTSTTTTTIPPTTTTTSGAKPCPGLIVNGVCVIPL